MNAELDALVKGEYSDPHHLLGGHPYHQGDKKGGGYPGLSSGCLHCYAFNRGAIPGYAPHSSRRDI